MVDFSFTTMQTILEPSQKGTAVKRDEALKKVNERCFWDDFMHQRQSQKEHGGSGSEESWLEWKTRCGDIVLGK
jgi:hypothetical protein